MKCYSHICYFFVFLIFSIISRHTYKCESLSGSLKETEFYSKSQAKSKTYSRVEAVAVEGPDAEEKSFSYYSKVYFRKLFSFNSPLNKCDAENCEYCCLSLNFCGSKEQCQNSNYTMNILRILFFSVCGILFIFLAYKIYITDSEPEHQDEDKVDDNTLNLLIGLFIQNRENRRKFKL